MRKSLGVLAILFLLPGQAFSDGWPSLRSPSSCPACAGSLGANSAPGYYAAEDNPLYPELTKWSFKPSQCKQAFWTHVSWGKHAVKETPYFPPLPYSNRALFTAPGAIQPQAVPPPASVPGGH